MRKLIQIVLSLQSFKMKNALPNKVKSPMPNTKVGSISLYVALWNIGSQTYFSTLEDINLSEGNQISLVWLPNYDFSLESHLRKLWTPFSSLCLILKIFFPFLKTIFLPFWWLSLSPLSYPGWQPVCAWLLRDRLPRRCQALCILTSPHSTLLSSLCFHLVLFTNSFWLLIHIPLWVDFSLEVFPWTCRCITMTLGLYFVSMMW